MSNAVQLIEYLLTEAQNCVIECLNEEQNKVHPDERKMWHYEDLLAGFRCVLDKEATRP